MSLSRENRSKSLRLLDLVSSF